MATPVRRKRRRASPRTRRCKYVAPSGVRCVRIATDEDGICQTCAQQIAAELGATATSILDDLATGRISLGDVISSAVSGFVGQSFPWMRDVAAHAQRAQQQARAQQAPPRAGSPPRSRPSPGSSYAPPRPRGPDPRIIQARKILGFDTYDQPNGLTEAMISDRRKQLARKHHPDLPGGSTAKMQQINAAADLLIAQLGKRP